MKKNLVLGLTKNYSWYVCEHFMRSFIKNMKNADLVIFVDDLSPFTLHKLEEAGKEIQGGELKLLPFAEEFKTIGHPANTRWLAFSDFLKNHADEYDQVLCADTRDVIFQKNIFDIFADQKNYFAVANYDKNMYTGKRLLTFISFHVIEIAIDTIGTLDEEKSKNLKDKLCLCPSVFVGSSNVIRDFLETFCKTIGNYDVFTADEAAFDYLLYSDIPKIENKIFIDSQNGEIMNLNILGHLYSLKTENDFILNPAGNIPAVIHYYDRNLFLMNFADKVYRVKEFDFDENFTDNKSVMDQLPHLVLAEKFEEALRIFIDYLFAKTGCTKFFNVRDQAKMQKINLDALTEADKKALKVLETKGDSDAFIRMWEIILDKNLPITNAIELLELSIQRALMNSFDKILPLYKAEKICACMKIAEKLGHIVSLDFKKFILDKLYERAKYFVDNVDEPRYYAVMFSLIELVSDLNMPLDEKWRTIKNKAYSRCAISQHLINYLGVIEEFDDKDQQKDCYRPHRLDADFENGGLKNF